GGEPPWTLTAERAAPLARRHRARGRLPGAWRGRRPEEHVAKRPQDSPPDPAAPVDFAALNGWDGEWDIFSDYDLPTYVGPTTFMNLPWITDPAELRARNVDGAVIGAPFRDAVSHRQRARF